MINVIVVIKISKAWELLSYSSMQVWQEWLCH